MGVQYCSFRKKKSTFTVRQVNSRIVLTYSITRNLHSMRYPFTAGWTVRVFSVITLSKARAVEVPHHSNTASLSVYDS